MFDESKKVIDAITDLAEDITYNDGVHIAPMQFLQRFPVVETGNGEGHPLLGKLSGNGSPDSAGRTGDKHLFHGKTSFLLHIITHCGERYKSITLYSK